MLCSEFPKKQERIKHNLFNPLSHFGTKTFLANHRWSFGKSWTKKHRINSDFPKKNRGGKNDVFNCKLPRLSRSTWGIYKLVTIKLRLVKFQRDFCIHKLFYLKLKTHKSKTCQSGGGHSGTRSSWKGSSGSIDGSRSESTGWETLLVIPILAEQLFILNFPIHRTHVAEEQMIHDQTPLHV